MFRGLERQEDMKTLLHAALASAALVGCISESEHDELADVETEIINGDPVNPANTGLVRLDTDVSICSSTLLDNTWLLTAAHCVDSYLDHAFDGDGHAQVTSSGYLKAADIAIDAYGRAVVAGTLDFGKFFVTRLRADGSLDPYFSGGNAITDFANATSDEAKAIAIDSYGRIIVAGKGVINDKWSIMVARYRPDGSLDTSFSGNGLAQTYIASSRGVHVTDVDVDSAGRVVVLGYAFMGTTSDPIEATILVRYTASGAHDTSFGGDGIQIDDLFAGRIEYANALALDSYNRPVITGNLPGYASFVARYTAGGVLDTTFSGDGTRAVRYDSTYTVLSAVAVDPSNRVVVGGWVDGRWGHLFGRFTTTGAFDTSFGGDGWVLATGDTSPTPAGLSDVTVDHAGRIVGAGIAYEGSTKYFSVMRLSSAGARDRTFDTDGVISALSYDTANRPYQASAVGLAIDSANNVLVGSNIYDAIGVSRIVGAHLDRPAAPDVLARMDTQARRASRVIRHPSLDVALVRLSTPLAMNGSYTGYQGPALYTQSTSTLAGKTLRCYGYGVSTFDDDGAGELRTADLPVIATSWSQLRLGTNGRHQALASGDSGGPCFYGWYLAGVTSHGTDAWADQIAASAVASWIGSTKY